MRGDCFVPTVPVVPNFRGGDKMKRIVVLGLCALLILPALAQDDFHQLFSGKGVALTLQLKDLNSEWSRVSITTQGDSKGGSSDMLNQLMQIGMMSEMGKGKGSDESSSGMDSAAAMMALPFLMMMFGGGSSALTAPTEPVYYTQGKTVTMGSETFLIAYKHQTQAMDLMKMAMESEKTGEDPDFEKLTEKGKLAPDSTLELNLINVKTIITIKSIRAFDMEKEIAESAKSGGLMDLLAESMKDKAGGEGAAGEEAVTAAAAIPASTLAFMVEDAIAEDAQLRDKRNKISVVVGEDVVILKGTVVSQYMKTRATTVAQQTIKDFSGAAKVQNQLVVKSPYKK
jgi:hypothetical protein